MSNPTSSPRTRPRNGAAVLPTNRPTTEDDNRFDLVLFLRHLAISVGAIVAYVQQSQLELGWAAFAIVTSSALLNFACSFLHRRPALERASEVVSSVIGVGCWTALVAVTGGVTSAFIAGLWLEIILAAMLFALSGIVAVTIWSIASLWALQVYAGVEGMIATLLLQSGFLAGMGGLTYGVARNALRNEERLVQERDDLDERLQSLASQLESEREVGRIGEGVARLAHGLKNAVHSLRGFVSLIEPTVGERSDTLAALAGLRTAIDDLEALARLTLEERQEPKAVCRPGDVVERGVREISFAEARVAWTVEGDDGGAELPIAEEKLLEVVLILLRNAVEAMEGRGRGSVSLAREADVFRISVADEGPGISQQEVQRIFEPGYTTKREGSGYGLFLAQRVLAEVRGTLSAQPAQPRGTVMELRLPVAGAGAAEER